MKLVTSIITTHNRSDLLRIAIESVLYQTYNVIECIVVDDASNDNTRDVCKKYPVRYIYIPQTESHGGNYARNLGIKEAQGEYCAFLDDDDYWLPTKIEKQMKLIEKGECDMVYCLREYNDVLKGEIVRKRKEYRPKPYGNLSIDIFKHYVTSTSCILAKKSLLLKIGGFDENFKKWQEYDLMIRAAQATPIFYVDEELIVYRNDIEDENRISNDFTRILDTIKKIRHKYKEQIRLLPFKKKLYFADMCINDTYQLAKKSKRYYYVLILFLPYLLLKLFKSLDDKNIARYNMKKLQTLMGGKFKFL